MRLRCKPFPRHRMAYAQCEELQLLRKHQLQPFLGISPWQVLCWVPQGCDPLELPFHLGELWPLAATKARNTLRKFQHQFSSCWCLRLQGPALWPCGLRIPSVAWAYTNSRLHGKPHAPEHNASYLYNFLNPWCFSAEGCRLVVIILYSFWLYTHTVKWVLFNLASCWQKVELLEIKYSNYILICFCRPGP